jgi:hypothetical protein
VPRYDALIHESIARVGKVLGHPIKLKVAFVEEENAYWDPGSSELVFGKALIDKMAGPELELTAFCVAAHEICHSFQTGDKYFDLERDEKTVFWSENQADVFACLCMALHLSGTRDIDRMQSVMLRNRARIDAVSKFFARLGTTDFTDPHFHGTAEDRASAIENAYMDIRRLLNGLPRAGDIAIDVMDAASDGAVRYPTGSR